MKKHDLHLPEWGPYTKKYIGVSHIADPARGWRFDLSVAPGFYRRTIQLPNVLWESGHHPWEASPDLEYFCHRHELEWKDQVYCDIAFAEAGVAGRFMRCECVNRTDSHQGIGLHLLASLQFPDIRPSEVALPPSAIWWDALDYESFRYGEPRSNDGLVSDLLLRGEVRGGGFVQGSALSFGRSAGDVVDYQIVLSRSLRDAVLLLRYRAGNWVEALPEWDGIALDLMEFPAGSGEFSLMEVKLGAIQAGNHRLRWQADKGGLVEWDGFVLVESEEAALIRFGLEEREARPEWTEGPHANSLFLQYQGMDHGYGIAWDFADVCVREFLTDDLDCLMRFRGHDHVSTVLKGPGEGQFMDVHLRPIFLEPKIRRTIEAFVCCGPRAEVMARLAAFDPVDGEIEKAFKKGRAKAALPSGTPAGSPYRFSQARMSATTLTNVVYPIYARRSFVRHNTPGRWWDSLYTWDSGFIGLGLLELDTGRAIDCLNAYLTEPDDPHSALAHHGSPVPVQHYLFQQIWNRTHSRTWLEKVYPRLRQYHHFLSGRDERSATHRMKSGLIQTWDYFYSSGGWDDYPPQKEAHASEIIQTLATASNTAHCIRTAKILRMAAYELGAEVDIALYNEDIARFTKALQTYAWDETAGYFSYVTHDAGGQPNGVYRHSSGANFNMGLDGVSPLLAGICTPAQRERLLGHLRSSLALWTPIGLSTVDQSAPYYSDDGYWNGAVWMPHQWFIWRALLDLGEGELAFRLASTALELWAREVENSYNCFEHFVIKTGRGAGWHQFSGLSSPVLCWFAAYYKPGQLSAGLDVWVCAHEFSPDSSALRATLRFDSLYGGSVSLIAVMKPTGHYNAFWEGTQISVLERSPGTLEITFVPSTLSGRLEIGLSNGTAR